MDELEISLRLLELEHEDLLSKREVMHTGEWGAPLGWVTTTIIAGWLRDIGSAIIIGLIALMLYYLVNDERVSLDRQLKGKRDEISKLLHTKASSTQG